ncbi:hypothetical protein D9M71_549570 [compost metagenome]
MQIRDGTGACCLGLGTGQAHAVVGPITGIVRFAARRFGKPFGTLLQVAGLLRRDRGRIVMLGIRYQLQGGPLALQREGVIALGIGNRRAQGPLIGTTGAA